jgi:hypothetical protein
LPTVLLQVLVLPSVSPFFCRCLAVTSKAPFLLAEPHLFLAEDPFYQNDCGYGTNVYYETSAGEQAVENDKHGKEFWLSLLREINRGISWFTKGLFLAEGAYVSFVLE